MAIRLLLTIVIISCVIHSGNAARILLIPFGVYGHIRQLSFIGKELVGRGHDVHMLLPESLPKPGHQQAPFKIITHSAKYKYLYSMDAKEGAKCMAKASEAGDIIAMQRMNDYACFGQNFCLNILEDENLYAKLQSLNFDIAIVGVVTMGRCALIVPYNLGIPFVGFTPIFEPWLSRNPSIFLQLPSNLFRFYHSEKMCFWERLQTFWTATEWLISPRVSHMGDSFTHRYIHEGRPKISLNEIAQKSSLWLLDQDMLIDYPRPMMPNEIYVGGLSLKKESPLEGKYKEFMDAASEGAIIMSFGSTKFKMETVLLEKFMKAFRQIGSKVVMKHAIIVGDEDLPENVLSEAWIPQNDLLAHPNAKVFITHCGNNGQMEALYHGVPMIGFALFGDQMYNCHRMVYHNFGLSLNLKTFQAEDLVVAVSRLLSNDSYSENIKHASRVLHDRSANGRSRAADGVEHALKHGTSHLQAHALIMPWYEYFMLDILLFFISVFIALVLTCTFLVSLILKRIHRGKSIKKD